MDITKLNSLLQNLGLSQHEASVYLAALSLGPCTVLSLSKTSRVKRTTIYSVIESLKDKGLITIKITGFKRRFVAEDPRKLQHIIEKKREELTAAMPELELLKHISDDTNSITYYEGIRAIKTVYEKLLEDVQQSSTYYVIGNQEFWYSRDKKYFQNFIERRGELARESGVKVKLLLQNSSITLQHKRAEVKYEEIIRILPKRVQFETNLVITDFRVLIHQLHEPDSALVIENPSIIKMHKELFQILWLKK